MSNLKVLEIFTNAKDSISPAPAARKRMKKRYKMQLWKLSAFENLFQIDMETSRLKLHYRDYSLDANEFKLFPVIKQWLLSRRPEERKHIMYYNGDLGSIVKTVGITPKQFITHHIDFCKQNLADLRNVIKRMKRDWKDSGNNSEETGSAQSHVESETRLGKTNNSESYQSLD
jgi:hypothetical protein